MESVVAIILARGGSKSVYKKQITSLVYKPLIYYCLDACVNTPEIDEVVATTECPIIGEKLLSYPGKITAITDRDPETSADTATSEMAVLDTLNRLDKKYDICLLVQATSPLTESKDLQALISLVKNGYDSAACYIEDYGFFLDDEIIKQPRQPRQERTPLKRETGNAWAFKIDGFKKYGCRTFGNIGKYKIEFPKNLEIDSWDDRDLLSYYIMKKNLYNSVGKIIYIDIDATLIYTLPPNYQLIEANKRMIELLKHLYKNNTIILWTSRGTITGINWLDHTRDQINSLGIPYHKLKIGKPQYDFWIDDKSIGV